MRKHLNFLSTLLLILIFLVGLSVMLYPTVSDWWNSKVQSRAIASYSEAIAQIDDTDYEALLNEARDYNARIAQMSTPFIDYKTLASEYEQILNVSGTGIMGYISIPVIGVELPIYHGTGEAVLNIAAGHLEGSSLPVGGNASHAVISAHRGLPSARLFTDLDQLVVGDTFTITILDEVLTYEVEQILIVLPHEMDKLAIQSDKDYVTLMTCTPYGVNTHRLLLRSHRIDTVVEEEAHIVRVSADAVQVDPLLVVPAISAPLVVLLLIFWSFGGKKKKSLPYRNPLYTLFSGKDGD